MSIGSYSPFWWFRIIVLSVSLVLLAVIVLDFREWRRGERKHGTTIFPGPYSSSLYIRLIILAVCFLLAGIDPFGHDGIYSPSGWFVISAASTFLVISLSISLIFSAFRIVVISSGGTNLLRNLTFLYTISQVSLLGVWVIFPLLQAFSTRAWLFEGFKLFISSIFVLFWGVCPFILSFRAMRSLMKVNRDKLERGIRESTVQMERLFKVKMYTRILFVACVLFTVFACVQLITSIVAFRSRDTIEFNPIGNVPDTLGELFAAGIFIFAKQAFCFAIVIGIHYLRKLKLSKFRETMDQELMAVETPVSKKLITGEQVVRCGGEEYTSMEERSQHSETSILMQDNMEAA